MSRDPAECTGLQIITAARMREHGHPMIGGCEFLTVATRRDGEPLAPCWVPTLALLVEMVSALRPPHLHLQCAAGEDRDALLAMIAPGASEATLH